MGNDGVVDMRSDRPVPCEGGCGRSVRGRERGVTTYLCAPCTSRQARKVRAVVMAEVAKRVQAERRILVTQ